MSDLKVEMEHEDVAARYVEVMYDNDIIENSDMDEDHVEDDDNMDTSDSNSSGPSSWTFSSGQRRAYNDICGLLSGRRNVIVSINTQSGTGKTYLLTALACDFASSAQLIVFRRDQASGISSMLQDPSDDTLQVYTYMSFYTRRFELTYNRAVRLFNLSKSDDIDILYNLLVVAKRYINDDRRIIIVDSCTIPSASMVLLLYIISLKHNMHLIFAGNDIQFSAMCKSSLHNESNFVIIERLSDHNIRHLSNNQMYDELFHNKVHRFREMIELYKTKVEVKFHFNLRYHLFRSFRTKYFVTERFDTVYMAQYHRDITNRMYRFIAHLEENRTTHYIVPFYTDLSCTKAITKEQRDKFLPGLLLVEGWKYVHVAANGVNSIVELTKVILSDNNWPRSVVVRFLENGDERELSRCQLNHYQILHAYRSWLTQSSRCATLIQFPLRPYTLTYHSAMGRTINNQMVELNADCLYANAIYIGLCCVRNFDDINRIHAERDLLSFVITDYMWREQKGQNYYYRCPPNLNETDKQIILRSAREPGPNEFIDRIRWTTVENVKKFEKKNLVQYTRIPCDHYTKPSRNQNGDTRLTQIAEFIKHHSNFIMQVMDQTPNEEFDELDQMNNERLDIQRQRSNLRTLLKIAYEGWLQSVAAE